MPKSKAKNTPKAEKRKLEQPDIEKNINDRLAQAAQGDKQQIVYIGAVVEKVLMGEFGSILRALLKGRSSMTLQESRHTSKLPAERYLGRLDAYERIFEDLEQYVLDKDLAFKQLSQARTGKEEISEIHHAPDIGEESNIA